MKRSIIIMALLSCVLALNATNILVVRLDGKTDNFQFSDISKICFLGSNKATVSLNNDSVVDIANLKMMQVDGLPPVIKQYTITTDAENGTVSGAGIYDEGTQVTLTATPAEHYHFTRWTDDNTDNPRTITVTQDSTYVAEFAIDQFTITVTSSDTLYGTVTGSGVYDYNANATLTATAKQGYEFQSWSDGNTDNPRTLLVTEDKALVATFIVQQTAVDNITVSSKAEKVIINGQIYIIRNGVTYTAMGQVAE